MNLLELAKRAGLNPKWKANTQGGEYESPCPSCGGKDRFIIQPNRQMKNSIGYYFCRKCTMHGDSIQFCREILEMSFKEATAELGVAIVGQISLSPTLNQKKSVAPPKPKRVSSLWEQKAEEIINEAYIKIFENPEILEYLALRGLPLEAIKKYKIGWIPEAFSSEATDWGLNNNDKIWIFKGIIIPALRNNKIVGLKIRRQEWNKNDKYPKYYVVTGGTDGFNIVGETNNQDIMIVVESELDALAAHFILHDIAFVVAIGGSIKNPDNIIDYLAKHKKHLFICHDNDEAGIKTLKLWKELYPHAIAYPTPIGKDIGEAIQQGFDIRSWILAGIESKTTTLQPEIVITNQQWSSEDRMLIDWVFKYVSERTITRFAYDSLLKEIYLGPNSHRAVTRELQNGLLLMKQLVEKQEKEWQKNQNL